MCPNIPGEKKHTERDRRWCVMSSILETNFLVIIYLYFWKCIIKTAREYNRRRNETLQVFFFYDVSHTKRKIANRIINFLKDAVNILLATQWLTNKMLSAGRRGRKTVTEFQSMIYSICDYHMQSVSWQFILADVTRQNLLPFWQPVQQVRLTHFSSNEQKYT